MMDLQKKATVLHYISAVWGKTVDTLLDLKDGHFYIQILGLLDQWNKKEVTFQTDKDRLICVKKFLQEYYGNGVDVDEFLSFDILLQADTSQCESNIELLLAKIAVVLLGIGVLDKNGEHFIGAAMQLPAELHFDVMAIIQSVVQAGSTEVCLTSSIEAVLVQPTDSQTQINAEKLFTWLQVSQNFISLATKEERVCLQVSPIKFSEDDKKSPPICNLQRSFFMDPAEMSTPKEFRGAALFKDSPLRSHFSALNHSLQDILSPLKGLNIDTASPSSPLTQFVQSPQLAYKVFVKQKELEIRRLKQQLNEQDDIKYELQFSLQDKISECVNKDAEIYKLQDRVKELLYLMDSYDELQDLKSRHSVMEKEMSLLNKKLLDFEMCKDQCQILKEENSMHDEEVEKLQLKIEALEVESGKYRDSLKTITHMETQANASQLQLEVMHKLKAEWEAELIAMRGNFEMAKETSDKLRHELEELQAKQEENLPGENMGIFLDMQLGELRCQVEELRQENQSLLEQYHELQKSLLTKDEELNQQKQALSERDEVIAEMNSLCKHKEQDLNILKEDVSLREQSIKEFKELVSDMKNEIGTLNESASQKDTQINALEYVQCALQEQIDLLKNTIVAKDAECAESVTKISNLMSHVSELESELQSQSQEIISLFDTKSNLEEVLKIKFEELTTVHNDLSDRTETITKLESDQVMTKEHLACKQIEIEELCRVNVQIKEETQQYKEQLTLQFAAVEELTESLQLKEKAMVDLRTSNSETITHLQATCTELRNENKQYMQQLQCRDSELQSARDEQSAGNVRLLALSEELERLQESLEEKSILCRELQGLVSQHSDELIIVAREKDQVKNNLTSSENEVKGLQESMSLMKEQFNALHVVKCEQEERISVLQDQVKTNLEQCSVYEDRVSSLTKTVSSLETELQSQSQEVISLSETKSHLEVALGLKEQELSHVQGGLLCKSEAFTKLEADLVTTRDELRRKETESEDLCQVNSQLKDEIVQVKEQLSAQAAALDELTETLNAKSRELLDMQSEKASLEDARSTLEITCEDLRATQVRCEQQLIVSESELQHIKNQLSAQCTAVEELTAAISIKSTELLEERSQKASLEDVRGTLEITCEDLRATQVRCEQQLIVSESELQHIKNQLSAQCTAVEELTAAISIKSTELLEEQSQKASLENELQQIKAQLNAGNVEMSVTNEELVRLKASVEDKSSLCKQLQDLVSQHSDELVMVKDERDQVKNKLLNSESQVLQLKDVITLRDGQLQNQDAVKCELEEQINILNNQMKTTLEQCHEHNDKMSSLTESVLNLERQLQTKNMEFNVLSDTKSDLEEIHRVKEEELSNVNSELALKNEVLTKLETDHETAKEHLRLREVENKDLCQGNAQLKEVIEQLREQVAAQSTTVIEVTEALNVKSAKFGDLVSQNASLEQELQQIKAGFAAGNMELSSLSEEIVRLNALVEEKSSLCKQLQGLVSQHSDELLMVKGEREQVQSSLTSSESEVMCLKDVIHLRDAQLQKQDAVKCEMEEQIHLLNSQMKTKLKQCSVYEDRVSSLTKTVSSLETELQSQSQEIISLSETKSHLEAALGLKEQELSHVQGGLLCKSEAFTKLEADLVTTRDELRHKETESEGLCQVNSQLKDEVVQVKEQLSAQAAALDELTETLNAKSRELLDMQSEKASLEDARSTLEITCEDLRATQVRCEQQLIVSESELQHIKNQLSAQCTAVEELTAAISIKSTELLEERSQKASLEDVRGTLEITCEDLRATQVRCEQQLIVSESELQHIKNQLSAQCTAVEELTAAISIKSTELLEEQSQKASLENELQQIKSQLDAGNLEMSVTNEELVRLKASVEEKSSLCKQLQDLVSQHSDELVMVKDERDQVKNDLLNSESQVLQLKDATRAINEQLEAMRVVKCELEEQIKTLQEQLMLKSSSVDELTDALSKQKANLLDKSQLLKDLTNAVDINESRISDLTSKLEHSTTAIVSFQDEIQNKEEHILQLLKSNQEQLCSIEELTVILQSKESSISELSSELDKQFSVNRLKINENAELSEAIQGNAKQFEDLREQLKSVENELEEKCTVVQTVTEELLVKDALIVEKSSALSDTSSELQMIQEQLNSKETAMKLLEMQLKEVHLSLEDTFKKLADREKIIVEKNMTEQEKTNAISAITLSLEAKTKELDSLREEHKTELGQMKEDTDKMLEYLQLKFNNERESDLTGFAKQKEDLESQITSLKLQHETQMSEVAQEHARAINKAESEIESTKEAVKLQLEQQSHLILLENKIRTLQEENARFRDRESKRLKESDAQMRTANEFCNTLRKQLDVTNKKLESSEIEMKNFSEQSKRYELQVAKMKDTNASLTNALKIERDTNMKMQKRMESYTVRYGDLKVKCESVQSESKTYASEVNKLKTSLDYADRKLREYKTQLDQAGTALLGDASHFRQIIEETNFDSLDDSLDSRASITRSLRSRSSASSGSYGLRPNLNETILSGDRIMLRRETLASATDLRDKGLGKHQTEDRLSICSTSSSQSIKSMSGIPAACLPNALSCANEPEGPEFEWNRLSELQRRNTLYPAHLKSAYPVEMQIVNTDKISDDNLRLSIIPNRRGRISPPNDTKNKRIETATKTSIKEAETRSYKRRATTQLIDEEMPTESPTHQEVDELHDETIVYYPVIHTGTVYQRPGPPTPAKQPRRITGKFTPSHGKSPARGGKVKLLGSPIARPNQRQRLTPRRSPRIGSPLSSAAEDERRESVAFSIGFTPNKSGANRMQRQKGFIAKDKPKAETTDTEKLISYGKGKAGQPTGQVSFSASSHDSHVGHEICHNACLLTNIDEHKVNLHTSMKDPSIPKCILANKDSVSLYTPLVVSCENLKTLNLTKQQSVTIANKSANKVTHLGPQPVCRAPRRNSQVTPISKVPMSRPNLIIAGGLRTPVQYDSKNGLKAVIALPSGNVAKLREINFSPSNNEGDNLEEVKSVDNLCDSIALSGPLQDITSVHLTLVQTPYHTVTKDLSMPQSQEGPNSILPQKQHSAASSLSNSLPAIIIGSTSSVKKLINSSDMNTKKEKPRTKRRLFDDKLIANELESEPVSLMSNSILKKGSKKITIKRAMNIFHASSKSKKKSKLTTSSNELHKTPTNKDSNNMDIICQVNCNEIFSTDRQQQDILSLKHPLDNTKTPLVYSNLGGTETDFNEMKDGKVKEKFKLSKLMKKALPFWKKSSSKHAISGELYASNHHTNELEQLPPNLKAEIVASCISESQLTIEAAKKQKLAATPDPDGSKSGLNVTKLRAKFEHSQPKEAHVYQNASVINRNSVQENVFKKGNKLKSLRFLSHQVSPKPKLVTHFTDMKETIEARNNVSPGNLDLQIPASTFETVTGKTKSPLQNNVRRFLPDKMTPLRNSSMLFGDNDCYTPYSRKQRLFPLGANKVTPIQVRET